MPWDLNVSNGPIADIGGKNSDVRSSCWVSQQRTVGHRLHCGHRQPPSAELLETGQIEQNAKVQCVRYHALVHAAIDQHAERDRDKCRPQSAVDAGDANETADTDEAGLLRDAPHYPSLSPRELETLALLADGASNKVIARQLKISVHTAKFHVAAVLAKLHAQNRADAVAMALRQGLLYV
ncbi:DNA-binding CsgD family transcriptional regulator [Mycoplana sp. BE70]|uniref:response regulator transcription factor n=1 Tax=Mycoplana sp. BE70 TaxID=2817775 RepID=UPI00285BED30|nr:helix-turn-helix transcriptional regulator [Mycoplana sp. BE70]MDR6759430.1 DNA-binding CsgD family transcriptional regulator [Mycoplana sp. BE70]